MQPTPPTPVPAELTPSRFRPRQRSRLLAAVLPVVAACMAMVTVAPHVAAQGGPTLVPLRVVVAATPQSAPRQGALRVLVAAAAQATPSPTPAPLHVVVIGPLQVVPAHPSQRPVPLQVLAPVPSPGDIGRVTETSPPAAAGAGPVNLPPVATLPLPVEAAPVGDSVLPFAILAVLAGILMGATLLLSRRTL